MNSFKAMVLIMVMIALSACAGKTGTMHSGYHMPDYPLMPPSAFGQDAMAHQQIQANISGQEYIFEAAVNIDSKVIELVMLSPLGQRIATLKYDGSEINVRLEKLAPAKFPFEDMIGIIEMIYSPMSALRDNFQGTEWHVVQAENIRNIYYKQELVAIVQFGAATPMNGKVTYRNIPYNYHVTINSVLLGAASPTN